MLKVPPVRRSKRHIPEGFEFLLEGKPHPLLIPTVISEICSYLTLKDLKSIRLVCKEWEYEAFKKIRKISKVQLQDEEKISLYTKIHCTTPKEKLPISYEIRGDVDLGSQCVTKFFDIFGAPVEYVYFNRVKWVDHELKNILFNQLPNLVELAVEARAYSDRRLFIDDQFQVLPKIKKLRLNVFSFITELTTPFLRDILRACPNVEKISSIRTEKRNPLPMQFIQYVCQEMSYDTADDVVNMPFAADIAIAEALIDVKDVSLQKLSILDCNMRLRGHGLQQLGTKNFPIKQLDLTLLADVQAQCVLNVLQVLVGTLESLKLKFHPRCSAAAETAIPPLRKLKKLQLNGYRHSLKLLEGLPNLRELVVIRQDFSRAILSERIELDFKSKLESLQIHEDFGKVFRGHAVRQLVSLFPFVKKLRLENLLDDAIRQVFFGFPLLEELDARLGLYSDRGVTGWEFQEGEKDWPLIRCQTYVGSLSGLRSLYLASPKITDTSVSQGVIDCHSLRRVYLQSSNITDISITKILEELDLFYFKTEFCFKISKKTADYVKEKLRGREVSINEYEGPLKQSAIPAFMRRNGSVCVQMQKIPLPSTSE